MVFFVDGTLGGFGDGNDFVGKHEAFVFNFVNEGITGVHAGTVIFGGVNMGDKWDAVVLFGKDAGFIGEPVMGMG